MLDTHLDPKKVSEAFKGRTGRVVEDHKLKLDEESRRCVDGLHKHLEMNPLDIDFDIDAADAETKMKEMGRRVTTLASQKGVPWIRPLFDCRSGPLYFEDVVIAMTHAAR